MPARDSVHHALVFGGLFLLSVITLSGAPPEDLPLHPPENSVISEGEYLVYEVSWTVFKLGTIRLWTHGDYTAEAYVDSYEGLPIVDLHSIHYTKMDSCFYSLASHSVEKHDDEWQGQEYRYDTARRCIYVEEICKKDLRSPPYKRETRDSVQLATKSFLDGVSIAFFPRGFLHAKRTLTIPTVLYGKLGETTFRFSEKPTTESIDADPQPVRVITVTGSTSAEGIYGMSGDFTGWFSDDEAGVPIKGKLQVLIGSVTVELIQWTRKGWTLPR